MKIKISENIRNLRKAHSLTQEQFAEILGIHKQIMGCILSWIVLIMYITMSMKK